MAIKIQILSNTNYSLANVLKSEFVESTQIKIAVAFVKKTGIDELYKSMDYAMNVNNAKIEIITGLDFKTTDSNALLALKEIEDSQRNFSFFCFGDKKDNFNDLVFHPKIYLFETMFSKNSKYTSIIGSSNLTGGGLKSNLEVNSIFKENKPIYYSQLKTIYDEIKFTDSIFKPSKDYIIKYGNIKKEIVKSENDIEKSVKTEIQELKNIEQRLPGTVPSLKKIIIEFIKKINSHGINTVSLDTLYEEIPKIVINKKLKFKMDTFKNTLRGELNKHEKDSKHKDNMNLFVRTGKGRYSLTNKAMNYNGR